MKGMYKLFVLLMILVVIATCGSTEAPSPTDTPKPAEPEPTKAEVKPTDTPEVAEPEPTKVEVEEGEPLVVGLMTDKSGPLAIYGPSQTQGFYLGLEYATDGTMEVAGRPIKVIEKDNASNPETGVSQARELIEAEGAEILVGNISSGVALAVMPVAEENGVVFIAEPAAAPQITADNFSPNTFRTSRTSYQDALVMGTGLLAMGATFVQIAPD